MTFVNNTENNGRCKNSIFTTSVLPCTPFRTSNVAEHIKNTFNWTGWTYQMNTEIKCGDDISSDIGKIVYDGGNHVIAYPGWEFNIPIIIADDYGKDMTDYAIFNVNFDNCIMDETKDIIIWRNQLTLYANEDCNATLTIHSMGQRVWLLTIDILMQY